MTQTITKDLLVASIEEHQEMQEMVSESKYQTDSEANFAEAKERSVGIVDDFGIKEFVRSDRFMPAGSILSGAGKAPETGSLSNCYLTPIENDSIEAIYECQKNMALTFARRGGTGIVLNVLRPADSKVNNAAIISSGAVSFMPDFSSCVSTIGQSRKKDGSKIKSGRRGALLMTLDVRHPDTPLFIESKSNPEAVFGRDPLTNLVPDISAANISVAVTKEFMDAVENDADWTFWFPDIEATGKELYNETWDGDFDNWKALDLPIKKYQTIKARDLLNDIAKAAHKCGDPGIMYMTAVQMNTLGTSVHPSLKPMGCNPCVIGKTKIMTKEGEVAIEDRVGIPTTLWNGRRWTRVMPEVTGTDQEIMHVEFDTGESIQPTLYHTFYLGAGRPVKAQDLKVGNIIEDFTYPHSPVLKKHKELLAHMVMMLDTYILNGTVDKGNAIVFKSWAGESFKEDYRQFITLGGRAIFENMGSSKHPFATMTISIHYIHSLIFKSDMPMVKDAKQIADFLQLRKDTACRPKIVSVYFTRKIAEKVYCFTDFEDGRGMFNGIVTGQCGEQPLAFWNNCLLAAMVLPKYVTNPFTPEATFNKPLFLSDVHLAVRALNNFSDANEERHPLQQQRDADKFGKRIGLEVTGLADMLAMLHMNYDSIEAREFVSGLFKEKALEEIRASLQIAKYRGYPCPALEPMQARHDFIISPYFKHLLTDFPHTVKSDLIDGIQRYGLANTAFNTVGPCGSISIIAGNCSSGVEPIFRFAYTRKNRIDGKTYSFIHRPACEYMLENLDQFEGLTLEQARDKLNYREAQDIPTKDRLKMQSVIQEYTDSAISSTLNLPSTATWEEIATIYTQAYWLGLKGVTVFRDGCKDGIFGSIKSEQEVKREETVPQSYEVILQDLLDVERAERIRAYWKGKKLYINVSLTEDNDPIEVFAKLPIEAGIDGKEVYSPTLWQERTSNWDLACRLISLNLRAGIPLGIILKQLDRSTYSMVDAAGILKRVLQRYVPDSEEGDLCPECEEMAYFFEGGCGICKACGFTTCG